MLTKIMLEQNGTINIALVEATYIKFLPYKDRVEIGNGDNYFRSKYTISATQYENIINSIKATNDIIDFSKYTFKENSV